MRYQLAPISTRPWLLNGPSLRLIESHYENHYGGGFDRSGTALQDVAAAIAVYEKARATGRGTAVKLDG